MGGLIIYFIGSNMQSYILQTTLRGPVLGQYSSISHEPIKAFMDHAYLIEGGKILRYSFYQGLLDVYPLTAPIAAILASYVLAMEKESGFSLAPLLVSMSRRTYIALKVLAPWITYVVVAGLSGVIGVLLLEPFLPLTVPEAVVYVLSLPMIMAGFQLTISYIAVLQVRSSYRGLIVSLIILYASYIMDVHGAILVKPENPPPMAGKPGVLPNYAYLGLTTRHYTVIAVELLALIVGILIIYRILVWRYQLR